ncbi:MAG: SDR family oxidoreductase [Xanthomonadales bacterium]|nr:SDR family oxidoreductase [Xanthomonadales bacterium]
MQLKDKVIVITGAGRGLGAAMAQRLAGHGSQLVLVDLDEESLNETSALCQEAGSPQVRVDVVNVTDEAQVEALFESIADQFGALHGLVNNAGITRDALTLKFRDGELVSKMTMDQWQLVMDVNLTGTFLCGREAALRMVQTGSKGCIINISSISRAGNMGQANYSATKAAVQAMAVTWAKEFARYGIRCASIAPGFIGTEMVMSMKPEAREKLTSGIPLRRVGDPSEIAHTVEFIFENDYVSGRCFEVDGALRM